jgi:molybdopterin molybdotransferase
MVDKRNLESLTPLSDALRALSVHCGEVSPIVVETDKAGGRILAAPVHAPNALPPFPIALCDGWAVAAQETLGASSYTPVFATRPPRAVAIGSPMPADTDAVLPPPSVDTNAHPIEILGPTGPGDGMRARGGDLAAGQELAAAGTKLRSDHVALCRLAGVETVGLRIPHVALVSAGVSTGPDPTRDWLAALACADGARASLSSIDPAARDHLGETLARDPPDLVVLLGAEDLGMPPAKMIESSGEIVASRLAMRPGEAIACGVLRLQSCDTYVPVVALPRRIEMALAAHLLLLRPCLNRLCAAVDTDRGETLPLNRKIVSSLGMSDLVLLRRAGVANGDGMWEVLAMGDISWAKIAAAEAWLLVAPECEGYGPGQPVFAHYL